MGCPKLLGVGHGDGKEKSTDHLTWNEGARRRWQGPEPIRTGSWVKRGKYRGFEENPSRVNRRQVSSDHEGQVAHTTRTVRESDLPLYWVNHVHYTTHGKVSILSNLHLLGRGASRTWVDGYLPFLLVGTPTVPRSTFFEPRDLRIKLRTDSLWMWLNYPVFGSYLNII